jgi:hypothetical protein
MSYVVRWPRWMGRQSPSDERFDFLNDQVCIVLLDEVRRFWRDATSGVRGQMGEAVLKIVPHVGDLCVQRIGNPEGVRHASGGDDPHGKDDSRLGRAHFGGTCGQVHPFCVLGVSPTVDFFPPKTREVLGAFVRRKDASKSLRLVGMCTLDQHYSGDTIWVLVSKHTNHKPTNGVANQNVRRGRSDSAEEVLEVGRHGRARSWQWSGRASPDSGAIVRAGSRRVANPLHNFEPAVVPHPETIFEDHAGTSSTFAVHVDTASVAEHDRPSVAASFDT